MRLITTAVLAACITGLSSAEDRELPPIFVHEWGVLSWSGPDFSFSGSPFVPVPVSDPDGMMMRAPVLYFHGPEFTGTVTVRTDNGLLSHIYPEASDGGVSNGFCSWTGSFTYDSAAASLRETAAPIENRRSPFPLPRWPYHLWRTGESMTVTTSCATEGFLYYETTPDDLGFLPCSNGGQPVSEEWGQVPAIVLTWSETGPRFAECRLGDIPGPGDEAFVTMTPDLIHRTLRQWSRNVIDIEEVDALWNTWTEWFSGGFAEGGSYPRGLLLYPIPESLLSNLSTIEVVPEGPSQYPTRVRRLILAAVPL
ncbi:MAG: hypothetical protein R6V62_03345 [Candidatus Fermentibacteraceae bacterium]